VSQDSVDTLRAIFAASGRGEADGIVEICAPDVVWHLGGDHVLSGEHSGPDEVRAILQKLTKFPEGVYSADQEAALMDGDFDLGFGLVVTRCVVARPGTEPSEWRSFDVIRCVDGQIHEIWTFASPEENANVGFACPVPAAS
jgi:ketosteroid isomerase-like protein